MFNKISNANVYIDGINHLGHVEEVKLPDITMSMTEQSSLGMIGKIELPNGIEKMEATFIFNSLYPEIMKKAANPYKSVSLQVRGSLESFDNEGRVKEESYVVYLRGTFKKFPLGNFKQHEAVKAEVLMAVTFIKMAINMQDIVEIDTYNNIFKVSGLDILAVTKNNQ